MLYRKAGHSGIKLPVLSLGLWHNFGNADSFDISRDVILSAFDLGVCHFDLANNYGPPPGSAELRFGQILNSELQSHRDELFISSKAGHDMWSGIYGSGGSRKNIIASCNQSLKRTGLDYFDVFYSHCYDPETPIEETVQALVDLVRQGKALYVGISKYPVEQQHQAYELLWEAKVPCLVSQYRCSLFDQKSRYANFACAVDNGSGLVCFSPLAQGLLAGKYNNDIPADSRVAKGSQFLKVDQLTPERIAAARKLEEIAQERQQSLAQMSLAWVLNDSRVTSVVMGISSVHQLQDNMDTLNRLDFTEEELRRINEIVANPYISF